MQLSWVGNTDTDLFLFFRIIFNVFFFSPHESLNILRILSSSRIWGCSSSSSLINIREESEKQSTETLWFVHAVDQMASDSGFLLQTFPMIQMTAGFVQFSFILCLP